MPYPKIPRVVDMYIDDAGNVASSTLDGDTLGLVTVFISTFPECLCADVCQLNNF